MQGKYLSEVVNIDDFKQGKINLIYAPCGSGKTTFAKTKLLKYFLYGEDYKKYGNNVDIESDMYWHSDFDVVVDYHKEKILYLIDTAIGKEQLIHSKGAKQTYNTWIDDMQWILPGFHVMTYTAFGYLCANYPEHNKWKTNAMIVCDELHNAVKWSKYSKKIIDENGIEHEEINFNAVAISEILYGVRMGVNEVIALSATPKVLFNEMGGYIHQVELFDEPRHFEENEVIEYNDLGNLLRKIPPDKRGIVYVTHVEKIIEYQKLLIERGIKSAAIWSKNNLQHPLTDEQLKVRDYIIINREMPPDIKVLFINKSCETSVTIGDEDKTKYPIDYMIIHSTDEDTLIQVRGRYRNDLDILYCCEPDEYDIIDLPDSWIGHKLKKADKDALCSYLGLKNKANGRLLKWTSIKKALKYNHYIIYDFKDGSERCSIIYSPNSA